MLLMWGEKDSLNPVHTVAPEVKSCFSNVQLMVVPGAGHIAIGDRPKQTVLSILTFLKLPRETRMDTVDVTSRSLAPRRVSGTPGETLAMQAQLSKCGQCGRTWELPEPSNGICPHCKVDVATIQGASGINVRAGPSAPLDDRRLAAASQMPVPMIFGHSDSPEDNQENL